MILDLSLVHTTIFFAQPSSGWSHCTKNPMFVQQFPLLSDCGLTGGQSPEHSGQCFQPFAESADQEADRRPFSVLTLRQKLAEQLAFASPASVHTGRM